MANALNVSSGLHLLSIVKWDGLSLLFAMNPWTLLVSVVRVGPDDSRLWSRSGLGVAQLWLRVCCPLGSGGQQ